MTHLVDIADVPQQLLELIRAAEQGEKIFITQISSHVLSSEAHEGVIYARWL